MTRKRLRYSELAAPPLAPAEELPAPAAEPADKAEGVEAASSNLTSQEAVADTSAHAGPPDVVAPDSDFLEVEHLDVALLGDAVGVQPVEMPDEWTGAAATPTRPRRNSTPIELARTLTAERLAARAQEGAAGDDSRDESGSPTIEPAIEPQRTLRERARSRSGSAELLMFRVGGERFAVELILVDEVIDLPVIHHVPEMPPAMLGVVTVRGSLTPVYSPQHALGLPLALRDALLIFRRGPLRVGILIDDVDDALSVDMAELREKPAGEEGDNVLLGVIRLANALIGIIDADALITSCQSANILEPA
jgi:purine-binding chemotaxis protein CheW